MTALSRSHSELMKLVCYFESMNRAVSLAESPDALRMELLSLGVGDGAAVSVRVDPQDLTLALSAKFTATVVLSCADRPVRSRAPGRSRGHGQRRRAAQNGGGSLKSPPRSACRSRALVAIAVATLAGALDLGRGPLQAGPDLVGLQLGDRPLVPFGSLPAALPQPLGDHHPVPLAEGVGQVFGLPRQTLTLQEAGVAVAPLACGCQEVGRRL